MLATGALAALLRLLAVGSGEPELSPEVERLVGHEVLVTDTGYRIVDIAGEGPPLVGCIERVDRELVLVSRDKRLTLLGPLAVPRIAGPRYKVWVIGSESGTNLTATRLGILAGPDACARSSK